MKRIALGMALGLLLGSYGAGGQSKTPPLIATKCDPKLQQEYGDGFREFTCSLQGVWVEDKEIEKQIADEEKHKDDLAWALRTRPLTDKEMVEVQQYGKYLLVHSMQPYSDEEVNKEFNDDLAEQFLLAVVARSQTNGGCCTGCRSNQQDREENTFEHSFAPWEGIQYFDPSIDSMPSPYIVPEKTFDTDGAGGQSGSIKLGPPIQVATRNWQLPGIVSESEIRDIAPKEWDTDEHNPLGNCLHNGQCFSSMPMPPDPPETIIVHHVECEDKTRFKLQSEDGRIHCLRLP